MLSVHRELRVKYATAPARTAATIRGLNARACPAAGPARIIGRISAVSIAAGTYFSARSNVGGMLRRANTAMNDSRDR